VYVPALNGLYRALDEKIGHYRRYSVWRLREVFRAAGLEPVELRWVNFLAIPAWAAFSRGDVDDRRRSGKLPALWDRTVVPFSRFLEDHMRTPDRVERPRRRPEAGVSDRLEARRILVTGGSLGIGLEVSRALARQGHRVIVAAREIEAIDAALDALDGSSHEGVAIDVSNPRGWDDVAARIDGGGRLHGLVTAAGVLGPIGPLNMLPAADLIETIAINLVGTMLALRFALPRLHASGGRAVTFSGGGGTSPLPRYDAYAASKAAVVRLTENVAASGEVEINAVAPGFVATRMHEETLRAGPDAAGQTYYTRTQEQLAQGGFAAAEAAALVCFLLSDDARGITGRLISAQWDPWREDGFRERLRTDDSLATLRRIDDQFFARIVA
jgi:NAD(P)-dependent dehydrogenase (short-subunit alcohol dehydrogenase family)